MTMKEIGPWGGGRIPSDMLFSVCNVAQTVEPICFTVCECRQLVPGAPSGSPNGGLLAMGNVGSIWLALESRHAAVYETFSFLGIY